MAARVVTSFRRRILGGPCPKRKSKQRTAPHESHTQYFTEKPSQSLHYFTEAPPPPPLLASTTVPVIHTHIYRRLTFQSGNRASSKAPHAVSAVRGIIRPSGPNGCGKRDLRAERALSPDDSPPAIARIASPVCVTASRQPTIGLVATPANPWKIPVTKPCTPSSCSHSQRIERGWGRV